MKRPVGLGQRLASHPLVRYLPGRDDRPDCRRRGPRGPRRRQPAARRRRLLRQPRDVRRVQQRHPRAAAHAHAQVPADQPAGLRPRRAPRRARRPQSLPRPRVAGAAGPHSRGMRGAAADGRVAGASGPPGPSRPARPAAPEGASASACGRAELSRRRRTGTSTNAGTSPPSRAAHPGEGRAVILHCHLLSPVGTFRYKTERGEA